MSNIVQWAMLTTAGAAVLACAPAPAMAQPDRNIQPDCARINDPTARLTCYDDKNRTSDPTIVVSVPPRPPSPQGGMPIPAPDTAMQRRESVARSPERGPLTPSQPDPMTFSVIAVVERGPGAYLMTMDDGAQWEFAEDMAPTYLAPERGSRVEIDRGVFGSFRMRFDDQQPVRVRRLR